MAVFRSSAEKHRDDAQDDEPDVRAPHTERSGQDARRAGASQMEAKVRSRARDPDAAEGVLKTQHPQHQPGERRRPGPAVRCPWFGVAVRTHDKNPMGRGWRTRAATRNLRMIITIDGSGASVF